MKTRRLVSIFIILGLLMIGVCGCMNHQDYSDKILAELKGRYGKDFEIVKLSYEVDGENGNYYRAVCKETEGDSSFVAYYYLKGSDYLLSEEIGEDISVAKDEPFLVDTYPNMLLNRSVAEQLTDNVQGILFAIADIGAFDYTLTISDIEKGIAHCVANADFNVQSKLYVFASNSIEDKERFEEDLVQLILSMNAYKQSVDVVYIADENVQSVKAEYYDDIYMIEDRFSEDEKIIRYSWYFAERGKGVVEKQDVKGV